MTEGHISLYQILADLVLLLHFGIVLFVIGGLLAVLLGNRYSWPLVNALWFRVLHLAAISIVVLQAWLGRICPLTLVESWLRQQAGQEAYTASFIETWVQRVLYYQAPAWVFATTYTLFGLLVLWAWWRFPPRSNNSRPRH